MRQAQNNPVVPPAGRRSPDDQMPRLLVRILLLIILLLALRLVSQGISHAAAMKSSPADCNGCMLQT